METTIKTNNQGGKVLAYEGEEQIGQIDFSFRGNILSVDHTNTFEGHEGQGVANGMMYALTDYAVNHRLLVSPVCEYAQAWYQRHPQYNDLIDKHGGREIPAERITRDHISSLKPGEVFVFGSNLAGMHGAGAARTAYQKFGAVMGNGDGPQGQSYAIPTMQGGVETIAPYVDKFIAYARQHPEQTFLVTPIGCGIAGFDPSDIAPLFAAAKDVQNIHLPESFWRIIV